MHNEAIIFFWHHSQIFSSENYCELSVFPFDSSLLLTRYPSLWYLKLGSKHTNLILLLHLFNSFHSQSPPNFLRSQWLIVRWDTVVSWQLQLLLWSLRLLPLSLLMVSFLLMWSGRNGLRQASLEVSQCFLLTWIWQADTHSDWPGQD